MKEILVARWNEIGDKIVRLADEMPDSDWQYRPSPETRTFDEQLRHVAFWNRYAEKSLRGESADGSANELPAADFPDRAKLLPELRASFRAVAATLDNAQIDSGALDTAVSFIEHGGEHYGQLAVYARLRGIVPPASRP